MGKSFVKQIIVVFIISFFDNSNYSLAQTDKFCKAVEKNNLRRAEKIFKRQINRKKNGTEFYNGPGSGMQITHQQNLDSLVLWLKNKSCVADATWDKCQVKIAIYPGGSTIGVRFKIEDGSIEKCFNIQEGTTGQVNIFGWRPHIYKAKNILVYKRMSDCTGFIENQMKLCNEK